VRATQAVHLVIHDGPDSEMSLRKWLVLTVLAQTVTADGLAVAQLTAADGDREPGMADTEGGGLRAIGRLLERGLSPRREPSPASAR